MGKNDDFKKMSTHQTPERSPGFLLWHISSAWRASIENILKSMNLTHPQFVVLASLGWLTRSGEQVTQVAIGKIAGLDPNTTSQILKGLERKDLLKRNPASDRRAKNPLLTSKGHEVLAKALPAVESADNQFFHSLSSRELGSAIRIFHKLAMQHSTLA